jgi:hypothetical protein
MLRLQVALAIWKQYIDTRSTLNLKKNPLLAACGLGFRVLAVIPAAKVG